MANFETIMNSLRSMRRANKYTKWKQQKNEKLLDAYQNQDVLYDPDNPMYHNRDARHAALARIATEFQISVDETKIRIENLRQLYNRYKKDPPSESGETWTHWLVLKLRFLDRYTKAKQSQSNLGLATLESTLSKSSQFTGTSSSLPVQEPASAINDSFDEGSTIKFELDESGNRITEPESSQSASASPGESSLGSSILPQSEASPSTSYSSESLNKRSSGVPIRSRKRPYKHESDAQGTASQQLSQPTDAMISLSKVPVPIATDTSLSKVPVATTPDAFDHFGQFIVSEMRECKNPQAIIAFKQDVMMAVLKMQGASVSAVSNTPLLLSYY